MGEFIIAAKPFILVLHFIDCIFLIIVILLQAGQGAEVGAAFGGSSQTVFGARGATTLLSKITTTAALIFLVTSIFLTFVARNTSQMTPSVLEDAPAAQTVEEPADVPSAPAEAVPAAPAGE